MVWNVCPFQRVKTSKEGGDPFNGYFSIASEFTQLASDEQIAKTVQALEARGLRAVVFENGKEARKHALDLIPSGAEVYNSPSRTLEMIGLTEDIEHPTRFQSVRAVAYA
ncbi:MAG TPA: hypothetical protein VGD98_09350 [Ktedonobacteraceae bacterium]